uniref:Uncharacterized protein n=1 Tax=Knipowitschia caucasica TaxID=637954 RepID=A0AAV2L6W6_KNICA
MWRSETLALSESPVAGFGPSRNTVRREMEDVQTLLHRGRAVLHKVLRPLSPNGLEGPRLGVLGGGILR